MTDLAQSLLAAKAGAPGPGPAPGGGAPPGPPQGALSMPAGGPPGLAGGPPGMGGPAGAGAMPGAPVGPQGPAAPVKPKPGNEGLVNRVLALVTGEAKRKEEEEHRAALHEALGKGMMLGRLSGGLGEGMPMDGQEIDPIDQIKGYLSGSGGMDPSMDPSMGAFAMGGYAHGGGTFGRGGGRGYLPSHGPGDGDGRSDHVDAKLSPNEYVMDAETVSMLGNGSPDAGAKNLDRMRANVRRHKGKVLARGKFSPDAKAPEAYLPKGALSRG